MKPSIRFEIFKRDEFRCQYCGRTVPDVTLEVDHIIPRCEDGTDIPDNLITSCFDCNRGKGGKSLTLLPEKSHIAIEDIPEKRMQLKALYEYQKEVALYWNEQLEMVVERWSDYGMTLHDSGKSSTLRFLKTVGLYEVLEAVDIAIAKTPRPNDIFRYFCGVCQTKLRNRENA